MLNGLGGFTKIEKCGSKLDMVFSSKCAYIKLRSFLIDRTFDNFDHPMVCTELETNKMGKRIFVKVERTASIFIGLSS